MFIIMLDKQVYNSEGPQGRPLQRRNGPAWVHTLCASFIGFHRQSSGCIYACDSNGDVMDDGGDFEDDVSEASSDTCAKENSDEKDKEETNKVGPTEMDAARKFDNTKAIGMKENGYNTDEPNAKKQTENDIDGGEKQMEEEQGFEDDESEDIEIMETHHMVVATEKNWPEYFSVLKGLRHLKCQICHANDRATNVLRVPIQCSFGDSAQNEMFVHVILPKPKRAKKSKSRYACVDEVCRSALHVGCARWRAVNEDYYVHFWPGIPSDENDNPVCELYCKKHAYSAVDSAKRFMLGNDDRHTTAE